MKKKLRTLLTLVLSMLLILGTAVCVSAASQAPRYIEVLLKDGDTYENNLAQVQLYRVGDVIIPTDGTDLKVSFNAEFKDCGVKMESISDVYNQNNSEAVYRYALANEKSITAPIIKSNNTGKFIFGKRGGDAELTDGLYLVAQAIPKSLPGHQVYLFRPYLVSLPYPTDKVGGGLAYSLSTVPKHEIIQPVGLKVVKTWKGSKAADYDKITINAQLIGEKKGYPNITVDFELNKDNYWTYDSAQQDLYYPKDYSWQVREVKVPDGYKVSYTDKKTVPGENGIEILELGIVNTKIPPKPPLIQTGQLNWPIPLMAGLGLALILTGVVVSKHGRKKEQQ